MSPFSSLMMKTADNAISYRPALAKQDQAWVHLQMPDQQNNMKKKVKQTSAKRKQKSAGAQPVRRKHSHFSQTARQSVLSALHSSSQSDLLS